MKDFPFDKNDPPVIDQEVMDQIKKDWAESIVCEDGQRRKLGPWTGVPYILKHGVSQVRDILLEIESLWINGEPNDSKPIGILSVDDMPDIIETEGYNAARQIYLEGKV